MCIHILSFYLHSALWGKAEGFTLELGELNPETRDAANPESLGALRHIEWLSAPPETRSRVAYICLCD